MAMGKEMSIRNNSRKPMDFDSKSNMRSTILRLTASAVLLIFSCTAGADAVDDYVRQQMDEQRIPGLALVVVKNDKPVKMQGYGFANLELKVPVTPETVFRIGSVSKQFIATGIMLLVKDNAINLEDRIGEYLVNVPKEWDKITIRHLLTHTSGLVGDAPGFDPLKIQSDAVVIQSAYGLPLLFRPGDKMEYSNLGYFILAEIIQKASGKPWPQFMEERVFKPVGMHATRTTDMAKVIPNRADGYVFKDDDYQNAEIYLALRPSGAFLSTVSDMAKWDAALDSDSVLSETLRKQMWSPTTLNDGTVRKVGFGWGLAPMGTHAQVSHAGGQPGFRSHYMKLTDDSLAVIVLVNADVDVFRIIALANEIASRYVLLGNKK